MFGPTLVRHVDWPQYQRRRAAFAPSLSEEGGIPHSLPDVHERRYDRVLDSTMSGSFTGAVLNTVMRKSISLPVLVNSSNEFARV